LAVVAALMPWPLIGPHHWWAFVLATAAILAALRLVLGPQWPSDAGLKLSPAHAFWVIVAFVVVAAASTMLLHHVYQSGGLTVTAPAIEDQFGFLFQALNEEILFRALLIGLVLLLVRPASLLSLLLISLGLALVFPAAHFLMYRFTNPMHLALSLPALTSLFCAGLAMNNLYLAFRHIGFCWAVHAGWNVVWLPATFYDAASRAQLHEPQIFERVLGSAVVAASACILAALSFVFLLRRPAFRQA
jgi:hypothetical protein